MEAFEPKDFEYPIKKPSFDSVVRQKRREQAQKAEQEQYAVVNTEQKEDAPEPLYTEMEQKMMDEAANLSLVGHLSELRRRIIIMVVAIIIGTGIAYYYVDVLLDILLAPAGKLYYMRPTEAFFTYMKVSIVGGIILASPRLVVMQLQRHHGVKRQPGRIRTNLILNRLRADILQRQCQRADFGN